jgi:hypothetical protein
MEIEGRRGCNVAFHARQKFTDFFKLSVTNKLLNEECKKINKHF